MVIGQSGEPGNDAHWHVVEEPREDLELVPIPHQPLADYSVLERAAKHDRAMRILRVQVTEA